MGIWAGCCVLIIIVGFITMFAGAWWGVPLTVAGFIFYPSALDFE